MTISIKAIIFDFFGVICSDEYWNFVSVDKNYSSEFHKLADEVNLGKLGWQEFLTDVAEMTGQTYRQVERLYKQEKINPEFIGYIQQLHKRYKTALLTNAHYEFLEPLAEKAHLNTVFDEIIMSSRVGATKPSPQIYQYALDKLGLQPHEVIFVDDLKVNTDAAEKLGIKSILYESFEQCKFELRQLLADTDN